MSKAYCKWPAIIGIVIGSLIVLSLVWCLARCLCCGASCCCSCLRCCDCFTPDRHKRRSRDQDAYRPMMPNQGFQPMPSPMIYQPGGPQVATFDAGRKVHADSLPSMPTWSNAQERRVEEPAEEQNDHPAQGHGADVEMGRVNSHPTQQRRTSRGGYSQLSNGPTSPLVDSAYGPHATSYMGAAGGVAAAGSYPYNSDLGAQRFPSSSPPTSDFTTPGRLNTGSPAPTYATHDPQQNTLLAAGDTFVAGGIAPTPSEYKNGASNRPYNASSPPPPTYATRPVASQNSSFSRPYPQQGQNSFSHPQRPPQPYAPSISTNSTQYEPNPYSNQPHTAYSPSPYATNAPTHYNYPQQNSWNPAPQEARGYEGVSLSSPTSQRPPSLLQAGRKPVGGTYREI